MKKIIITTMTLGMLAVTIQAADDTAASSSMEITSPSTGVDPLERPFEVGAIFGEPTGLSLKYWVSPTMAIDGGAGWSFDDDTDFHLHADLLWHNFEWLPVPKGALPVYFGVGARGQFRDNRDDRAGIRFPIGMSYLFEDVPVSIFVEVAPVLDVVPSTHGDLTAGIGARYRF